jgi:BarA-like signal transduction histidine kinase
VVLRALAMLVILMLGVPANMLIVMITMPVLMTNVTKNLDAATHLLNVTITTPVPVTFVTLLPVVPILKYRVTIMTCALKILATNRPVV